MENEVTEEGQETVVEIAVEIVVDHGTDDDDTADPDRDHVVAVVVVVAAEAVDQSHIEQNSHWRLTI